jgi:hypothetical protein
MPLEITKKIKTQVNRYYNNLLLFRKALESHKQKHLLLIQPATILRNPVHMPDIERAIFNLLTNPPKEPGRFAYLKYLYNNFPESITLANTIFPMSAVHNSEGWVFLDGVHFSESANRKIAVEISNFIISDGVDKPFR